MRNTLRTFSGFVVTAALILGPATLTGCQNKDNSADGSGGMSGGTSGGAGTSSGPGQMSGNTAGDAGGPSSVGDTGTEGTSTDRPAEPVGQ